MPLTCFIQQIRDGQEIARYKSVNEAWRLSGISLQTISRSLNEPEVYYVAPFTWKYHFVRMPKKVKKVAPRPPQPEYMGLDKTDVEIDEIVQRTIINRKYPKPQRRKNH